MVIVIWHLLGHREFERPTSQWLSEGPVCEKGYKTYFLKATELNQKLLDARKYGREKSTINGLVKPSCLIIDEIGRCVFDKVNTRMFFDIIDRRYNKEGPNTLILTSNLMPGKWGRVLQ
ncbi:MAG: ATP-binding protein [Eubacterium sp.]|jgi:DNA replication protein DnaC|nr:ATP-binding protein [Eubacterium sp.]